MRRVLTLVTAVGAVTAATLLTGGTDAIATDGHQVLASGLNNPRQLEWSNNHKTLIIAEAGRGGDTCVGEGPEGPQCIGFSGMVRSVHKPWKKRDVTPGVLAKDLLSVAGPDGTFATGPDGADRTNRPGELIEAITGAPPESRPPNLPANVQEQLGHLVVSSYNRERTEYFNFPYLDFFDYEKSLNPDNAQLDSNPYAVLFVKDRSGDASGYGLIADAAANTVWKVDPDFSACDPEATDCVPPASVTVFHTWQPPSAPTTTDEDDIEYVPTSLARDRDGNVYVGGLGSLVPGEGKVTKLSSDGTTELKVWGGLTSVTGVAVSGQNLYVSQLFGGAKGDPFAPDAGPVGLLTKINQRSGAMVDKHVPFPAGVAIDNRRNVYVSANSVFPGKSVNGSPVGQIWKLRF